MADEKGPCPEHQMGYDCGICSPLPSVPSREQDAGEQIMKAAILVSLNLYSIWGRKYSADRISDAVVETGNDLDDHEDIVAWSRAALERLQRT